ncbi:hypothetical protein HN51_012892 [Arachis hypogaea]
MISAISWIPIGASKAEPTVAVPPSKEEIQDIITTVAASTADSENEEEAGDERMDDAGGAVDEVVRALNVADALRKADKLDDIAFGLKELDMEHYDDEDEVRGILASLFWLDRTENGGVIIDSGTSVTRLTRPAYEALRDAFWIRAARLKRAPEYSLFDTCFDLSGMTQVKVPTVVLHF